MTDSQTPSPPNTAIDIHEIMRRIPHRPPFLMIDRAEDYVASRSLVGIKCVTIFHGPLSRSAGYAWRPDH